MASLGATLASGLFAETPGAAPRNLERRGTLDPVLEALERHSLDLMLNHRRGGLLLDQGPGKEHTVCNIASEGFAFCAMVVGVERGMIERREALRRIDGVLSALENNPQLRHRGWISHLIDLKDPAALVPYCTGSGENASVSEYSTIDTTLFMLGALIAKHYFGDEKNIAPRIGKLFSDLEFASLLAPPGEKRGFQLSHGYSATGEKIPWYWDTCSEGILVSFLSQAQAQPALPGRVWYEWDRRLFDLPLFTSYYPHCFLNFHNLVDESGLDLRERTTSRMRSHVRDCNGIGIENGLYGVTACYAMVSQNGSDPVRQYLVSQRIEEGNEKNIVIAPHAIVASLPFVRAQAEIALEYLASCNWLDRGYGPINSVNPGNKTFDEGVTTIDVGSAMLCIPEVQKTLYSISDKVPEFQSAFRRCRISPRSDN